MCRYVCARVFAVERRQEKRSKEKQSKKPCAHRSNTKCITLVHSVSNITYIYKDQQNELERCVANNDVFYIYIQMLASADLSPETTSDSSFSYAHSRTVHSNTHPSHSIDFRLILLVERCELLKLINSFICLCCKLDVVIVVVSLHSSGSYALP